MTAIGRGSLLLTWILLVGCSSDGPSPEIATAVLEGVVLQAGATRPVSGVSVEIRGPDQEPYIQTLSDAEGRFILRNLRPGRHLVMASRTGFVQEGRLGSAGKAFTVTAGEQVQGATLYLSPSGAVSGRVLDSSGQPIADAEVLLLHRIFFLGRPQWTGVAPTTGRRLSQKTDDRGEFQITDLVPGEYIVRVNPSDPFRAELLSGGRVSPAVQLYPGVRDLSAAERIRIDAGTETRLNDIMIRPARMGRIRVHVENETGERPGFPAVELRPVDWIGLDFPFAERRTLSDVHEFQPDLLGMYQVSVSWSGDDGPRSGYARVRFDGRDTDVPVKVTKPEHEIEGNVVLEHPGGEREPLARVDVAFGPHPIITTQTLGNGAFHVRDAYAGRYQFGQIAGLSLDHYVASVRQGNRDVLLNGLEVPSSDPIEVLVSAEGAIIEGSVKDASGRPVQDALVALVPEAPLRNRTDYYGAYHSETTDQRGIFEIRGIAPGAYRAYAWAAGEVGAFRNSEYMSPIEARGQLIQIERGGRSSIDLEVLDKPGS